MGIVGAGTVLYRLGRRLGGGRSATALEIAQPFIWALPVSIVMLIVHRETIKGRLRAGLCSKCERPLGREALDEPCSECRRVNARMARLWLVSTRQFNAAESNEQRSTRQ